MKKGLFVLTAGVAVVALTGCSSSGVLGDKQMQNYQKFGEIYQDARKEFCQGNATEFSLSEYSIRISCADGSDFTIKTPQ